MRESFIQSHSVYKGLFYWLNWPGYISNVVLFPFAWVTMFGVLGMFAQDIEAARNYAIGMAGYSVSYILVGGITQSYSYDKIYGTLSFLFVSPANRFKNYCCRVLFHLPNAVIVFFFSMIAAWIVVKYDFALINQPALILSTGVMIISSSGYAQLTGVLTLFVRNWISIFAPAIAITFVATGATIPVEALPGFLRNIAGYIPLTNGLIATRKAFIGLPVSEIADDLLREFIIGIIYFVIGYVVFRGYEKSSRKTGDLERDIQ